MIKLERLRLRNFCQHRSFETEFGSGVVGLLGTLGAGKSNIIYAIKGTLTDDFTELGKKETCINWYCGDRDSYIEADWNLHGTQITIRRSLRPRKSILTMRQTGEVFDGQTEVAAELRKLIGIHEKVLVNYVFVEQWQTFAFISKQPADRAKLFSHLCGTEELSQLYSILTDQMATDRPLVVPVDENERTRLQEQHDDFSKRLQKIRASVKHVKRELDAIDVDKLKVASKLYRQIDVIRAERKSMRKELLVTASELAMARTQRKKIPPVNRDRIEAITNSRKKLLRDKYAFDVLQALKSGVPKRPKKPKKLRPTNSEELRVKISESLAEQGRVVSLLGYAARGQAVCSTCGTKLSFSKTDRIANKKKLKTLRRLLRETTTELAKVNKLEEAWQRYQTGIEHYRKAKTKYLEHAKEVPDAVNVNQADIDRIDVELHKANDALDKRKTLLQVINWRKKEVADCTTSIATFRHKLRTKEKELETLLPNGVDGLESLQEQVSQAAFLRAELVGLRENRETLKTSLAEIDRQLDKLKASEKKAKSAAAWLDDLDYMRDVLHHTALPRDIALSRLAAITGPINSMLQQFDMDFVVKPDESLSFEVRTGEGAVTTAARLSGGQKMLLAIAFWLAVNSIFISDVGFLTLDEPTAGLNRDSLHTLADVLAGFSRAAKMAGRQIILVTHESALKKVLDQCIELPPP